MAYIYKAQVPFNFKLLSLCGKYVRSVPIFWGSDICHCSALIRYLHLYTHSYIYIEFNGCVIFRLHSPWARWKKTESHERGVGGWFCVGVLGGWGSSGGGIFGLDPAFGFWVFAGHI